MPKHQIMIFSINKILISDNNPLSTESLKLCLMLWLVLDGIFCQMLYVRVASNTRIQSTWNREVKQNKEKVNSKCLLRLVVLRVRAILSWYPSTWPYLHSLQHFFFTKMMLSVMMLCECPLFVRPMSFPMLTVCWYVNTTVGMVVFQYWQFVDTSIQ